jgi:hypothetical protein
VEICFSPGIPLMKLAVISALLKVEKKQDRNLQGTENRKTPNIQNKNVLLNTCL